MSAHNGLELLGFRTWIPLIEMLGALLIMGYVLHAIYVLVRWRDDVKARLLIADGAIAGLSLKLVGTLLKTILISSWSQIGMFVVILALRTLLKRLFVWERFRLIARSSVKESYPATAGPSGA